VWQFVDATDAFGFYRPATQLSIYLDLAVHGPEPARLRALNVALHAGAIAMAFVVARLVTGSSLAAGLTTLAFALTPKAHPTAVLWISARAEILMSLFVFAAIASWIVWTRNGRAWWLAGAVAAYLLALTSKETATLLPLLLLLTPRSERSLAHRAAAVAGLLVIAAAVYAMRSHVGALTPFSGDSHYDLMTGIARWTRNASNYAMRMFVAPASLLLAIGLGRAGQRFFSTSAATDRPKPLLVSYLVDVRLIAFAAAFVVVFLAPVLPIALRSELYLYLPVFGVCLLAGWLGALLVRRMPVRSQAIALAFFVVALGGYQAARSLEIHRDLVFSDRLVAALRSRSDLTTDNRAVALVPSDATTERFFRGAIGGYLYLVLRHVFPGASLTGAVLYPGDSPHQGDLRLLTTYRPDQGIVVILRER